MAVSFDDHGHTLFRWVIVTTRLGWFLSLEDSARLGDPSINHRNRKLLRYGAYERFIGRELFAVERSYMGCNPGVVRLHRQMWNLLMCNIQLSGLAFALLLSNGRSFDSDCTLSWERRSLY